MNIIEKLNRQPESKNSVTTATVEKESENNIENKPTENSIAANDASVQVKAQSGEGDGTQNHKEKIDSTIDNKENEDEGGIDKIVIDKNFKEPTRLKIYIADIISSVEDFLTPFDGWFKLRALIYKYGRVEVVTDGSIIDIDSLFNKIKASGSLSTEGIHLLNTDLASIKPLIVNGLIIFTVDEELSSKATQVGMAIAERNNYLTKVSTAQSNQVLDEEDNYNLEVSNDFETEMA